MSAENITDINSLNNLLLKHKNKICGSHLSTMKINHLTVFVKLSEALYIDAGRFYGLSNAIEQEGANIEEMKIKDVIKIIEEQERFYKEMQKEGSFTC